MAKKGKKQRAFSAQLSMAGSVAFLDITGFIGWDNDPLEITDKVAAAKAAGCTKLHVRINSMGGYCYEGLAMGDALRNCGMETVGTVVGSAQSMAGYILQCCDVREANENATIMVHQPEACVGGTVDEIRTQAEYLCALRDSMFEHMGSRCGMTGAELSAEHMSMKLYTAQQALEKGLIDRITGAAELPVEPVEEEAGAEPTASGVYDFKRVSMALAMVAETEKAEESAAAPEELRRDKAEPETETETEPDPSPADASAEAGTEPETEPETETETETESENKESADAPEELRRDKEKPMTRAEVEALLAEREARMYAEMGVPRGMLPSSVDEGRGRMESAGKATYSMAELDAMPGMQRVALLAKDPQLAAAYARHI